MILSQRKPSAKIQKELDALLKKVEINSAAIEDLNMHWKYLEAKERAQDTLETIESAELLMAGKERSK